MSNISEEQMILVSMNFITSLILWLFDGATLLRQSKYKLPQRMSFSEDAMLVLIEKVLYKLFIMQLHSEFNLNT